ncbi:hypothetical protein Fcan01_24209 [Folsomia candida]|uniref:Uncharacterized protein n=1 Tax=Folsomia candida TaxID=158441 RepID=A0A226D8B1_FOLCA|nr:hypothetical protein Fcan01_24209 [Folsomia candida]
MNEWFLMPGSVLRSLWLKHSITFRKVQYAIYALPMELSARSLLTIFDADAKKFIRLRVITYVVIVIWLFNAILVASMFGGEFYSLFTSNRVPTNLPKDADEKVSSLKELTIPSMLNATGYSPEFRKMLNDLKARTGWSMGNKFETALRLSLDKAIDKPRPLIFAVTPRNPFGIIFEEYLGYLTEAGISDMWGKNYKKFMSVEGVLEWNKEFQKRIIQIISKKLFLEGKKVILQKFRRRERRLG